MDLLETIEAVMDGKEIPVTKTKVTKPPVSMGHQEAFPGEYGYTRENSSNRHDDSMNMAVSIAVPLTMMSNMLDT